MAINVSTDVNAILTAANKAAARAALAVKDLATEVVDDPIIHSGGGHVFVVNPDNPGNAKFWLNVGDQPNLYDTVYGSTNPTAQFGYNTQGAQYDSTKNGLAEHFEASWCTDVGRGQECVVERHTIWKTNSGTNTRFPAGTEIRLASYTIYTGVKMNGDPILDAGNPVAANIHYYMHVGAFELRNIHNPVEANQLYFNSFPGQTLVCGNGDGQRLVINITAGVCAFDTQGGITACTIPFLSVGNALATTTLAVTSTGLTSVESEGGMLIKKTLATYASVSILWYGLTGQPEPAAVGGAMQLYGKVIGSQFVPHARMGGDLATQLFYKRATSSAGNPTTTELPSDGEFSLHHNTTNNKRFFAVNDGGVIRGVELTAL